MRSNFQRMPEFPLRDEFEAAQQQFRRDSERCGVPNKIVCILHASKVSENSKRRLRAGMAFASKVFLNKIQGRASG